MADPRMMKLIQDMMAKKQASGAVVPETDDSADMAVESPDQSYDMPQEIKQGVAQAGRGSDQMIAGSPRNSYETSPEIQALLKQLGQSQPQASEAEVAPESIDMKKAALEKIKQKYLGQ